MEVPSGEVWKPISGSTGYEVSNFGNVRSYRRGGPKPKLMLEPHILKPRDKGSAVIVDLFDGEKFRSFRVHRLVAAAFIGQPPEEKPFVLHGDGNYRNNRLGNLRYGDYVDNAQDAIKHGTHVLVRKCCDHDCSR